MKSRQQICKGYSLIELLISMSIGVVLIGIIIVSYVVQNQVYKVTNSQAATQNAANAISALVTPLVRSVGFVGCSTTSQGLTISLNAGSPPPLGAAISPGMLVGYDASGTAGSGLLTLTTRNPANDTVLLNWSPILDPSLASLVQTGSDVLALLGPVPNSQPTAVTQITAASTSLTVNASSGLVVGQLVAISDCSKSTIFNVTGISGNEIYHLSGAGPTANTVSTFPVNYLSPQLIPLQQSALYVAQGQGGQSALMRAVYKNNAWAALPLVPGVQTMQVLYGIGANGEITQYVPANAVTSWTSVYCLKLAFLIEGQPGSGGANTPTSFKLLGTTVNVPQDGRMRRVYELTIDLRNAS